MRRRLLSQIVATVLGGVTPLTSMCGAGGELNGIKVSPTLFRVDNINLGGTGGMDTSAGSKGQTEYQFDTSKCRFIYKDGRPVNTECE